MTCRQVAEARNLAEQISTRPLLCGERGCKRIDGFDLGNSPSEYTPGSVRGRTLVMTTTNGTRAVEFADQAGELFTACFLNLSAVVAHLADRDRVHLVCAGTEGEVTVEDVLMAGALVSICETRFGAVIQDDDSCLARQLWLSWFPSEDAIDQDALANRLRETRGGRNLLRVGYEDDLVRCARVDSVDTVPVRIASSPATFSSASV